MHTTATHLKKKTRHAQFVLWRNNLLADESNLAHPTAQSEVGSVSVAPFPEKQYHGIKA